MADKASLIEKFKSLTGASSDVAKSYLESCTWNCDVSLIFNYVCMNIFVTCKFLVRHLGNLIKLFYVISINYHLFLFLPKTTKFFSIGSNWKFF